MNNRYFTYALIDPRTNTPFYIGKGSGVRDQVHLFEAHRPPAKWINSLKCRRILAIESEGMSVVIQRLREGLTEEEAYRYEQQEISKWGKIINGSGCLTNVSDGGEGGSGGTKPVRCYAIDGTLVSSFSSLEEGAAFADIHKSTVCAALNKRSVMAGGYRWSYEDETVVLTPHRDVSPVIQHTLDGVEMARFPSIKEAAAHVGVTYTSIVGCCTKKHEVAAGYRWCYVGDSLPALKRELVWYKDKKYQAFNIDGTLVGTFNTIKEAVSLTPANATGIIDCCAGRKKTSGGLTWRWLIE